MFEKLKKIKPVIKNNAYYNSESVLDEAIRTLRTNISFSSVDKECKSFVVTSSQPGDGKSTLIGNLAKSLAENDKKVILIDCDFRHPSVGTVAGVQSRQGITNYLLKGVDYKKLLIKDPVKNTLDYLLTGIQPPNPAELLDSKKMRNLVEQLKSEYDIVLIDTPPVGILTDAAILSTMVDGVILVASQDQTHKSALDVAVNNLESVNANIIGFVLNRVRSTATNRHYGYGYGYGQKYGYGYGDNATEK